MFYLVLYSKRCHFLRKCGLTDLDLIGSFYTNAKTKQECTTFIRSEAAMIRSIKIS